LILGIIVAAINIIIGVIWGSISGYYGGTVDIVMERLTDILGGIPWIVLMTVLTLQLGQNFFVFALALCLTGWIGTSSTTRSQFYRYRGREYVLASRTLGARAPRLIFRHILPNAVGTIITRSILMIPGVIFSEATISYLGLGLQNLDSLGVILSDTQKNLSVYPNQLIIPAIIISMLMICFNLFGNGLRDAFNPSLKGQD
jgi:oligopeptide transport system permease protein